jgi:hypothetical protein
MQYGNKDLRTERAQSKRGRAKLYVQTWLQNRPYLDKMFLAALYELLPELKQGEVDEFEHHPDHD